MARPSLGSLLSTASDTGAPAESVDAPPVAQEATQRAAETTKKPAPGPDEKPAPAASKRAETSKAAATPRRAAVMSEPVTHWSEYDRLEARLREDQVVQLDALVRRLNKQRSSPGERITKNTLLRVATDLLLAQGDAVTGETEAEIRASVITD